MKYRKHHQHDLAKLWARHLQIASKPLPYTWLAQSDDITNVADLKNEDWLKNKDNLKMKMTSKLRQPQNREGHKNEDNLNNNITNESDLTNENYLNIAGVHLMLCCIFSYCMVCRYLFWNKDVVGWKAFMYMETKEMEVENISRDIWIILRASYLTNTYCKLGWLSEISAEEVKKIKS